MKLILVENCREPKRKILECILVDPLCPLFKLEMLNFVYGGLVVWNVGQEDSSEHGLAAGIGCKIV
jgi:hypothetical protein